LPEPIASHGAAPNTHDRAHEQVDAVKKFWSQFGTNVVDHHMHEEGVFNTPPRMHRMLRQPSGSLHPNPNPERDSVGLQ
jgi:alkanesulfonate monooxygenase SsuD/methylene tetrahydromethanopterin reductase-like flavin-dependent oxidoreductase (luciferase family)